MLSKCLKEKNLQLILIVICFAQFALTSGSMDDQYYSGYEDDKYGQDMVGTDTNNGTMKIDDYGFTTDPDGTGGINPGKFGQDMADKKDIFDPRDSVEVSLNVWIDMADDWEADLKSKYGKYRGGRPYRKEYNEDDNADNYNRKGSRKKRSYKKVKIPVRHYKNIRRFPLKRFPPLFSTFPWLPIFYDKLTYQTFIFSPLGGIYVLPPLVNFFGRRIAVAQLIKWGYASLVATGVPPPPAVDVAPLVQPAGPGAPSTGYNANTGRFTNAIQLDPSKPQYAQQVPVSQYNKKNY